MGLSTCDGLFCHWTPAQSERHGSQPSLGTLTPASRLGLCRRLWGRDCLHQAEEGAKEMTALRLSTTGPRLQACFQLCILVSSNVLETL